MTIALGLTLVSTVVFAGFTYSNKCSSSIASVPTQSAYLYYLPTNIMNVTVTICPLPAAQTFIANGYIFSLEYVNSTTLYAVAYNANYAPTPLYYVVMFYNWTSGTFQYQGVYEVNGTNYIPTHSNVTAYYVIFPGAPGYDTYPPGNPDNASTIVSNPSILNGATFAYVVYYQTFIQNLNLPSQVQSWWDLLIPFAVVGAFVLRRSVKDVAIAAIVASIFAMVIVGALGAWGGVNGGTYMAEALGAFGLFMGIVLLYASSEEQP